MNANRSHLFAMGTGRSAQRTWFTIGMILVFTALLLSAVVVWRVAARDHVDAGETAQWRVAANLPLETTKEDFFLPGTQPGTLDPGHPILDPASCDACHTDPIYKAWRGSMMGNAGRDPVFWAAFAVAQNDAVDAGEFCLRCHTPRGWYDGRSEPSDGSLLVAADISAGVACEVCHRMVDPVAGAIDDATERDEIVRAGLTDPPPTDHFANGMLIIDPQDNRRGPFAFPPNSGPHIRWQTVFLGQEDPLAASRLCGSCHNVENPLLSWNENPPGGGPAQYWPNETNTAAPSFGKDDLFPIERTYEEWLNSDYANGVYAPQFAGFKPGGMVASCQDCHMVRQVGYGAETFFGSVFRDCDTTGCLPAHIMAGGNSWVPKILQDPRWRLSSLPTESAALDATAAAAQSILRRAATLEVSLDEDGGQKVLTVRVINETGHKLPTGYPEGRRMWLNVRAYDASGALIYESGAYDEATGLLIEDADIKVYEAEQGLTPEMAALVGLDAGPTFHFALNNTTIKDNRIPPRGYTVAAFDRPGLRPVGASYADGQHWDDTAYAVPPETEQIVVTLYYQLASKDYIDFLREMGGTDGETLGLLWDDSKSPPEIVAQAEFPAPNMSFVPVNSRP